MSLNKFNGFLLIALIVIGLIVGISIGFALSPEYRATMYEKTSMDLGSADRWLDLRYVNAMISHHRGAILMAEQVINTTNREEIKNLAAEIIKNEPVAINELYKWKKEWYGDSKKVSDPKVPSLGNYDEKYDLRFLNALIFHHEEGIKMVKEARLKTSRTEIMNNTDAVQIFLINSLNVLKEWRNNWYQI